MDEIWYTQVGKCLANCKGSATSSRNDMNFGPQTASNWTVVYPPSVNSAFHFIARLRWRRSANGTQPHFVKRWTVGRANNVPEKSWGRPIRKKLGAKNFLHLFGFSTSSLNGEYLLKETWHKQSGKGIGMYEGSPTLSQKFVNFGPQTA